MLQLKNISKVYTTGDTKLDALKNVSLNFRKSEFVSILGPSGCGKTTMLNIVGGLDRYTTGDLVINGKSTKDFTARDWDAYRNTSIGFVFQSYNLIPHLTVLRNVELALTLSGVSVKERRARAAKALQAVGLEKHLNKRPNQLSGGQMQRVAIARALVNDPDIILADEPTGALDSKTSVQIMDLLKKIASNRLVIMVTHNDVLADQYSTRLIRLLDGEIVADSSPYLNEDILKDVSALTAKQGELERLIQSELAKAADAKKREDKAARKLSLSVAKKARQAAKRKAERTAMGFTTALSLSGKNMLTKKGRTFMVSFAGSIGIIGIALVLAISNGFSMYISRMQSDTLSGFPIAITRETMDMKAMSDMMGGSTTKKPESFPSGDKLLVYTPENKLLYRNKIDKTYIEYVKQLDKKLYNDIFFARDAKSVMLRQREDGSIKEVVKELDNSFSMGGAGMGQKINVWQEMLPNTDFLNEQYDALAGALPTKYNEVALLVDKYNRVSTKLLDGFGITLSEGETTFSSIVGKTFKFISHDTLYKENTKNPMQKTLFEKNTDLKAMYEDDNPNNFTITITGVVRLKEKAPISIYSEGIIYAADLTNKIIEINSQSKFSKAQILDKDWALEITKDTPFGAPITDIKVDDKLLLTKAEVYESVLQGIGATAMPSNIYIYPKDFETKNKITAYLDAFNTDKKVGDKIIYTDASALLADTMGSMVDIISYVLIAFAGVSLVVSSIMIGIITYVSVIERTKEIGVLRSIGARKKDISRVFNAETLIIGFVAGLLGVLVATVLTFPINIIINAVISHNGVNPEIIGNLAVINPLHGLVLVAISVILTFISGLIPSKIAANKDPVVALRTE